MLSVLLWTLTADGAVDTEVTTFSIPNTTVVFRVYIIQGYYVKIMYVNYDILQ